MTALGNPITNDFECPLLTQTDTVLLVPPHWVQSSVSIIHQCTDTCIFTDSGIRRRIEREEVHVHRQNLLYKHDWSNNLYCLNIFCMNQWYSLFFLYACIVPTAFQHFDEFSSHVIQFRSMAQVIQNALTQLWQIWAHFRFRYVHTYRNSSVPKTSDSEPYHCQFSDLKPDLVQNVYSSESEWTIFLCNVRIQIPYTCTTSSGP